MAVLYSKLSPISISTEITTTLTHVQVVIVLHMEKENQPVDESTRIVFVVCVRVALVVKVQYK